MDSQPLMNSRLRRSSLRDVSGQLPIRYVIVFMVVLSCAVDFITRVNLNVAIVSMVKAHPHSHNISAGACPVEWQPLNSSHDVYHNSNPNLTYDWSPTTQGVILGSFWYSYTVMQVPSGRMAENFGGKWIIAVSLLGSAVVDLVTPLLASSLPLLICSRIVLGFLQGGIFPSAYAMIYKWMPLDERSTALAMKGVGAKLGSVAAASMTGYLSEYGFAGGWPSAFYVSGTISLVTFLLWISLVHSSPEEHPLISDVEMDFILSTRGDGKGDTSIKKANQPVPWRAILTSVPVLSLIGLHFTTGWTSFTIMSKLPSYLNDVLHVRPTENGLLNASLYAASIFSIPAAAVLSEKIIQRGLFSRTATRKCFATIANTGALSCLYFVPSWGCNKIGVMSLFIIAKLFMGCNSGGDGPVPSELTTKFPATIYALGNMAGCTAGFFAPYLIGVILESDAGDLQYLWKCVFYLAAILLTCGIIGFVTFASARRQGWDLDPIGTVHLSQSTEISDDVSDDEQSVDDNMNNEPRISNGIN